MSPPVSRLVPRLGVAATPRRRDTDALPVKVKEANDQQVLYDYAPKSTGSIAYTRFVEEVIARVER